MHPLRVPPALPGRCNLGCPPQPLWWPAIPVKTMVVLAASTAARATLLAPAIQSLMSLQEVLRKAGRCYVCLRRHHISKECRGRHHTTICYCRGPDQATNAPTPQGSPQEPQNEAPAGHGSALRPTNTLYVGAQTSILLQTARLQLFNQNAGRPRAEARAIMDSGSQRTYITCRLRDELNLQTMGTESLRIKTFGSTESHSTTCDVVRLGINTKDGETLKMTALAVPVICHSLTSQPISHSRECYHHLLGLELADSADVSDVLEVDVLIGSDSYWDLATGRIIRGEGGPTAIHTKVGWVLSGPVDQPEGTANLVVASTHTLKVDAYPEPTLDDRLRSFWDLESLGITKDETSVYEKFVQQIRYNGQRYEVSLPWKEHHLPLPDHLDLCRKRLTSLLKRLRQTPLLLDEYNAIIQDQLDKGIVEVVRQPVPAVSDRTHYLPHHGVVRQEKATSKLRIGTMLQHDQLDLLSMNVYTLDPSLDSRSSTSSSNFASKEWPLLETLRRPSSWCPYVRGIVTHCAFYGLLTPMPKPQKWLPSDLIESYSEYLPAPSS